jgi:hypothetical protein
MNRFLILATSLFFPVLLLHGQAMPPAPSQVAAWVMITAESATTAVVLPAGTTYRFGDMANNRWSAAVTVAVPTTFSPVSFPASVFPFSDPDSGTVKELDVLQTTGPQTVAVMDLSEVPEAPVMQIVPGTAPPAEIPTMPGTSYTVTFAQFAFAADAGSDAPAVAFVNAPPTLANRGWEGTQLKLLIDGVTLVCTPGINATDQSVTLSCTVPMATP